MPPSPSRPSHPLALPSPISKSNPNRPSSPPKKKRKRPRASTSAGTGGDLTRALDEADDVSDTELVAPDNLGRRMDMAASDEEDEEGEGEGGGGGGGGRRGKNEEGVAGRAKKRRGETLLLRNVLDQEQARRFDAFSTAVVPKQTMTRLNRDLYDQHVNPNLAAVIAGMAKIFVADVVELAKDMQPHSAYPNGPLRPYHLKLARIRLEEMGMLGGIGGGGLRGRKPLFRR